MWWENQDLELQEWEDCIKPNKKIILDTVMLVPNKNQQRYKEHVISFIYLDFGEGVTIMYCIENMKLYVSDIEKSYKYTIIYHLRNSCASDLLFHILQCWRGCAFD